MQVGLDFVTSAICKHQQQFGLDVQCSALVLNFNNIFSIGHLYRAGQSMNSLPSQILDRCRKPNFYPSFIQPVTNATITRPSQPGTFARHTKATAQKPTLQKSLYAPTLPQQHTTVHLHNFSIQLHKQRRAIHQPQHAIQQTITGRTDTASPNTTTAAVSAHFNNTRCPQQLQSHCRKQRYRTAEQGHSATTRHDARPTNQQTSRMGKHKTGIAARRDRGA